MKEAQRLYEKSEAKREKNKFVLEQVCEEFYQEHIKEKLEVAAKKGFTSETIKLGKLKLPYGFERYMLDNKGFNQCWYSKFFFVGKLQVSWSFSSQKFSESSSSVGEVINCATKSNINNNVIISK